MAFTLDDLAAVDRAVKSGASRVDYPDGGGITYRSMDDLLKAREIIVNDLIASGLLPAGGGGSTGAVPLVTQSLAVTSRE